MAPNEGSDEAMDDKDDAVATSSELGARDFRRNVEAIGHCFQQGDGWYSRLVGVASFVLVACFFHQRYLAALAAKIECQELSTYSSRRAQRSRFVSKIHVSRQSIQWLSATTIYVEKPHTYS